MAKLGAPAETMAALARSETGPLEILPECSGAVEAFLLCQTQWRLSGMGRPIGLDYAGVKAALEMAGVAATTELFHDLRLMESAAVETMAENKS